MSHWQLFRHRPNPCPCGTVNHNWTFEQRQDLARRLESAERYGLADSTRILRARLATCPHFYR